MQRPHWTKIRAGLAAGSAQLDRCVSSLIECFRDSAPTTSTLRRRPLGIAMAETLEPRIVLDSTVVFNEIMYHPDTSEETREWIELHNQMGVDMDLSGWRLSGGIKFEFAAGTVLEGGGYLVIAASPPDLIAETGLPAEVVLGPLAGRLNNSGETLRLRNNNDRVMDEIRYGDDEPWHPAADGGGVSLAKLNPNAGSEEAVNWSISQQVGGTPGTANFGAAVMAGSLAIHEIAGADEASFFVELANDGDVAFQLAGITLSSSANGTPQYVFPSRLLQPGELVSLEEAQLGFSGAIGDKLYLHSADGSRVLDAATIESTARARSAQHDGRWQRPSATTPGAANVFAFHDEIVINEIMYHHQPLNDGVVFEKSDEQWVELYNRGTSTVDLSGWHFSDGIDFTFPAETTLEAGKYLVVSKNQVDLATKFPGIAIIGDFDGRLARDGELLQLADDLGNIADEVRYYDGGYWAEFADGGGSSLELRDPKADNSKAEAWAASDESLKSQWQTYSYTGIVRQLEYEPSTIFHELRFGLLDEGEALIDEVSVIERPKTTAIEFMQNGSFADDDDHWRMLGTHDRSRVIVDPDDPDNRLLHLVADAQLSYMNNRVETTFAKREAVGIDVEYKVSFRAKWLTGSNQFRSEFHYNRLPALTHLRVPQNNGTPGLANSRVEGNIGPTYDGFIHSPVVPERNEPVTVSAEIDDPQGVASARLWWSLDGGAWSLENSTVMIPGDDGRYEGDIPGQNARSVVQFYVEATDGEDIASTFPAAGRYSRALYKVQDGQARPGDDKHDFRLIMLTKEVNSLYPLENILSNQRIGSTVVYDESEVFYDTGVRLRGSMYSRRNPDTTGYNIQFQPHKLFRDVHETISIKRRGMSEIVVKHLVNQAGDIPGMYDDIVRYITPLTGGIGTAKLSMARFGDVFLGSQYDGGSEGTVFKMEGIRDIQQTVDGNPESVKLGFPVGWVPSFDLADLGDDPEQYRWSWLINRQRTKDDYSGMVAVAQAFSLNGQALEDRVAELIDVSGWMRQFAMLSLAGIGDTYTQGNPHNFNIYFPADGSKAIAMPWDWDFTFNRSTGSPLWGGKNMSKVISRAPYKRMFYGHLDDMINTVFNTQYMRPWIDHYFQITGDDQISGFLGAISGRASFVRERLPAVVPFVVETADSERITPTGITVDATTVTLSGTAWVNIKEIRIVGRPGPIKPTWSSSTTHWTAEIPVAAGTHELVFEAIDHQGNLVDSVSVTVTSTVTERPLQDHLRITELMFNPAAPSEAERTAGFSKRNDFEFIEFFNGGDQLLDLTGVRMTSGVEFDFTATGTISLAPGQYTLAVRNEAAFRMRYGNISPELIAGQFTSGKLSDGGERLVLIDSLDAPILDFVYKDGWYALTDGDGFALSVIDQRADAEAWQTKDNWRPSSHMGGTPGGPETFKVPSPDAVFINEVLAHSDNLLGDWIELRNTTSAAIDVGNWRLSDDRANLLKYRIAPGRKIPEGGTIVFDAALHFGNPDDPGTSVPFALSELGDEIILTAANAAGEVLGYRDKVDFAATERDVTLIRIVKSTLSTDFVASQAPTKNAPNAPPLVGPVVIHEFNYNPTDGADEFIELRNITHQSVPLFDPANPTASWRFTNGVRFSFPTGTTLDAGSLALVVRVDPDVFRAGHGVPAEVQIFGPYLGSLSNAGEMLELSKPGTAEMDGPEVDDTVPMIVVDRVRYKDQAPWPGEADGQGASLQRLDAESFGNDVVNWTINLAGGTPGISPPQVTDVLVSGSDWSPALLDRLRDAGLGSAGYSVTSLTHQLQSLPWAGIDRISIVFSVDVDVNSDALAVTGVNRAQYDVTSFSYDAATFTATWTLDAPPRVDKLLLDLDNSVTARASGVPLDGNWDNGADAFPSGNEIVQLRDAFRFRLDVMAGDGNSDALVDRRDLLEAIRRLGARQTDPHYQLRYDSNMDGRIDVDDLRTILSLLPATLPAAEPTFVEGGPARSAVDVVFRRLGAVPSPAQAVVDGLVIESSDAAGQSSAARSRRTPQRSVSDSDGGLFDGRRARHRRLDRAAVEIALGDDVMRRSIRRAAGRHY